ncbi:MAG: hypothetical protein AB7P49_03460 [Bdellovibrionales bacterium]
MKMESPTPTVISLTTIIGIEGRLKLFTTTIPVIPPIFLLQSVNLGTTLAVKKSSSETDLSEPCESYAHKHSSPTMTPNRIAAAS